MRQQLAKLLGIIVLGSLLSWTAAGAEDGLDRLDHLRQAAEHLESAGLSGEAARIRDLAANEQQARVVRMLVEKIAAVDQLKSEIESLRRLLVPAHTPAGENAGLVNPPAFLPPTASPAVTRAIERLDLPTPAAVNDKQSGPQVKVSFRLVQLHWQKLKAAGIPLNSLAPPATVGDANQTVAPTLAFVDDRGIIARLLENLNQQHLLTVLAEPTVVTTVGRTALVVVKAEESTATVRQTSATDQPAAGIRLEVTPAIAASGKIRLIAKFSQSTDRDPSPRTVSCDCDTEFESGQTIVMLAPRVGGGPGLVALLTAEVLPSTAEVLPSPHQ